jgi:hypothetical protein
MRGYERRNGAHPLARDGFGGGLQRLLGTAGLSWMDWLLIVLVASSIWVADEILKWFGVHGKPRGKA